MRHNHAGKILYVYSRNNQAILSLQTSCTWKTRALTLVCCYKQHLHYRGMYKELKLTYRSVLWFSLSVEIFLDTVQLVRGIQRGNSSTLLWEFYPVTYYFTLKVVAPEIYINLRLKKKKINIINIRTRSTCSKANQFNNGEKLACKNYKAVSSSFG